MRGDRLEQAGRTQQFALRGAFAARQNHAVDRIVEILGGTQQFPRRTKPIQDRGMLGERALHRENAGHTMLRGSRTFGNVGRLFLRNVFNGNNHRISLPKPSRPS